MSKRKQTYSDRIFQRALMVLVLMLTVGFGFGLFGLVTVQIVNGREYAARADQSQLRDMEVAAPRGTIYDSAMQEIAQSTSANKVYLNPNALGKVVNQEEILSEICEGLGPILGLTAERIRQKASYTAYNYMSLKGQVDPRTMEAVNAFREQNTTIQERDKNGTESKTSVKYGYFIGVQPDVVRYYPLKSLAANVIGFTGVDDIGRAGLELYYNKALTGVKGRIVSAKNATDSSLPVQYESIYDPVAGHSLVLTVDEVVQRTLERSLEQAKLDTKAKAAYGIVMDVKTGAILGMACVSSFDPGNYQEIGDAELRAQIAGIVDEEERKKQYNNAMMAQWRNGNIDLTYEPGSVFKVVTFASALEEGVIDLGTGYHCSGSIQIANRKIRCHKREGHGAQTLTEGLMNSCNPFTVTIGQRLGVEKFYQYFEDFGFTEHTGIDLPNEFTPKKSVNIHAKENMRSVELASCSFGQSFEASPIQIITAIAAVANGGKLMRPYVVARELDETGRIVSETRPTVRRQVISSETAKKVAGMMEQVVAGGTGKNGYVAGGHVAGKTGTSQKLSSGKGYVASFCSFAPADEPEVALLIAIDEPKGLINGGQIAAPPAAEIMEQVLIQKNVEMRYTEKEQAELGSPAPDLVEQEVAKTAEDLREAGYRVRVVGAGETVLRQIPEPGRLVPKKGVMILYTERNLAAQKTVVPALTGMTIPAAVQEARDAGVNLRLTGNYRSGSGALTTNRQSVPPGEEVLFGETVTVHFISENNVIDR